MLYDLSFLRTGAQWPPESEAERLKMYAENKQLFEGNHELVFKEQWRRLLREDQMTSFELAFNWPKRLSTLWADLLFGEPPEFTAGDKDTPEQKAVDRLVQDNDLHNTAYEATLDVSRFGTGIFNVRYENRGIIEIVPPDVWFPVVKPDNIKAIQYHVLAYTFEESDAVGRKQKYLKAVIHEPGRIITRQFVVRGSGDRIGEQVGQDEVQTFQPAEFLVVPAHNLITSDRVYGIDDYTDLDSIVSELEVRAAQISRILDKHADPSMFGDENAMEYDSNLGIWTFKGGSKFFPVSKDGQAPGYIVWDGQLEAAFKQFELLMEQFYSLSDTSPAAFGQLKAGLVESGSALRRLMMAPLAKVNRMRMRMDPALKKALRLAAALEVSQGMSDAIALENISITWKDGIPDDETEETSIVVQRKGAGLISTQAAVARLDGLEGDVLQEELDRIAEEEEASSPPIPTATRFNFGQTAGTEGVAGEEQGA